MKITLCGSLDFTLKIKEIAERLKEKGHSIVLPHTVEKILNKEITLEQVKQRKKDCSIIQIVIQEDLIRKHAEKISNSDAILVVNEEKKGIKNFIGGNTFLEIGFAHVFNKKIFLLNDIPEMIYTAEIKAMQPKILHGDLTKI